jgi:hypothetical protein
MTPRDLLVSAAGSLIVAIVVGHFKGEKAALISLGIVLLLLGLLELFFYTKGLVIHYAGHGIGDEQYADVTTLLRGYIRNNRLNVPIDGTTFPDDPYRGKKKHVWVRYSYRSRTIKEKTRHDGDRMILP